MGQTNGRGALISTFASLASLVASLSCCLPLGAMLLSEINVAYYQELMAGMRAAIAAATFADYCAATREGWARGDASAP